jgi:hypothetical protein
MACHNLTTNQSLSKHEARLAILDLSAKILVFTKTHSKDLGEQNTKCLLHSMMKVKDPYLHFYLTFKIHKSHLKTQPIVSISGSLLHALG